MAVPIFYWIENEGPGRMAILARPQGHDALADVVEGWRGAGVDVVVSLLTEEDNRYLGLTREAEHCRDHGLQFVSFPIEDFGVPASVESAQCAGKRFKRTTGERQEYWLSLQRLHWPRAADRFLRSDLFRQDRAAGFRTGEHRARLSNSGSSSAS